MRPSSQTLDYGKLPPQSIELEEAVLGAMLLDSKCVDEVLGILDSQDFYKSDNQVIFRAISDLHGVGEPVDVLTVNNMLKITNELESVGGSHYIAQLTNRVASGANVEAHARIVLQNSIRRTIILSSSEAIKAAYDDSTDIFDLMDSWERMVSEIGNRTISGQVLTMAALMEQAEKVWEVKASSKDGLVGYGTGFTDFDYIVQGFMPGNFIVMAARPGMGKTVTMLQIAKNAAQMYGKRTGIITLEMTALELFFRLQSNESGIDYAVLAKTYPTKYQREQLEALASRYLNRMGIFFVDRSTLSDREFKVECRRLVKEYRVDAIVLDYLQLMESHEQKGNREQEISRVSRAMKSTAKNLGIPVIALSQLSRSVETRGGDKRPMLSDLRESGSIEQDADVVVFLYRPEYYGIENMSSGESSSDKMEMIIAKHRGGSLGEAVLKTELRYSRVMDNRSDLVTPTATEDYQYGKVTRSPLREENNPTDELTPF